MLSYSFSMNSSLTFFSVSGTPLLSVGAVRMGVLWSSFPTGSPGAFRLFRFVFPFRAVTVSLVPTIRTCVVPTDSENIRQSAEVTVATLYEAAVLAFTNSGMRIHGECTGVGDTANCHRERCTVSCVRRQLLFPRRTSRSSWSAPRNFTRRRGPGSSPTTGRSSLPKTSRNSFGSRA
jgi:hypothetical protein